MSVGYETWECHHCGSHGVGSGSPHWEGCAARKAYLPDTQKVVVLAMALNRIQSGCFMGAGDTPQKLAREALLEAKEQVWLGKEAK